jgi:hypothetical protein
VRLLAVWVWVVLSGSRAGHYWDRRDLILWGRVLRHARRLTSARRTSARQRRSILAENVSSLVSNHDMFAVEFGQ